MDDHGNGWHLVQSRRKTKRHKADVWCDDRRRRSNSDEVTYYFSRFPDNFGAKEMFRAFANYGRIVDVVIPVKRDKLGKRFGFARFIDVVDPQFFGTKLDNIIIGATKLNVNIPRFDRVNGKEAERNLQRVKDKEQVENEEGRRIQCFIWREKKTDVNEGVQKKSYAEAIKDVSGKRAVEDEAEKTGDAAPRNGESNQEHAAENKFKWRRKKWGRRPRKEAFKGLLCYDVEEEDMAKFQRKYIGYVKQAGTTYSVQEWFSRQGVFSVKTTPLGANSVLMEDIEEGTMEALLTDAKEWLLERFEAIKPWQSFVVDNERLVWVRCHGIPPHAWGEGICKLMANTMGTFVDIDEDTRKKRSLDIARILIRTRGFGVINRVFHITINGEVFPIKMIEEWCGPLRLQSLSRADHRSELDNSSDYESEFEDGFPLFSPEKEVELGGSEEEEDGVPVLEAEEGGSEEEEGETPVLPAINTHEPFLNIGNVGEEEKENRSAADVIVTRNVVQFTRRNIDVVGHVHNDDDVGHEKLMSVEGSGGVNNLNATAGEGVMSGGGCSNLGGVGTTVNVNEESEKTRGGLE